MNRAQMTAEIEDKFAKFFAEVWPVRAAEPGPTSRGMSAAEELLASDGGEVLPVLATEPEPTPRRMTAAEETLAMFGGEIWHDKTAGNP